MIYILQCGTLIFSIVRRFSEKWVTVTLSDDVAVGVFTPFTVERFSVSCTRSNGNNGVESDFVGDANGCSGVGDDDNTFDWFEFLFKFDVPVKFNVNLSPPYFFSFYSYFFVCLWYYRMCDST